MAVEQPRRRVGIYRQDRFAVCDWCRRKMGGLPCRVRWRVIGGRKLHREPYTLAYEGMSRRCHDCNTPAGHLHHPGCDMDRCPACYMQAICCEHADEGWPRLVGRRYLLVVVSRG